MKGEVSCVPQRDHGATNEAPLSSSAAEDLFDSDDDFMSGYNTPVHITNNCGSGVLPLAC